MLYSLSPAEMSPHTQSKTNYCKQMWCIVMKLPKRRFDLWIDFDDLPQRYRNKSKCCIECLLFYRKCTQLSHSLISSHFHLVAFSHAIVEFVPFASDRLYVFFRWIRSACACLCKQSAILCQISVLLAVWKKNAIPFELMWKPLCLFHCFVLPL